MISNEKFKEFLQKNKELIDSITPKNPTISKEDEWATDPIYEEWSQEEFLKQRDNYRKDYQDFCERYAKERNEIRFRTLDRDTDNFS